MPADTPAPLTVTRHDLDPTELVYVDCDVAEAAGNFSTAIRDGFNTSKPGPAARALTTASPW